MHQWVGDKTLHPTHSQKRNFVCGQRVQKFTLNQYELVFGLGSKRSLVFNCWKHSVSHSDKALLEINWKKEQPHNWWISAQTHLSEENILEILRKSLRWAMSTIALCLRCWEHEDMAEEAVSLRDCYSSTYTCATCTASQTLVLNSDNRRKTSALHWIRSCSALSPSLATWRRPTTLASASM